MVYLHRALRHGGFARSIGGSGLLRAEIVVAALGWRRLRVCVCGGVCPAGLCLQKKVAASGNCLP